MNTTTKHVKPGQVYRRIQPSPDGTHRHIRIIRRDPTRPLTHAHIQPVDTRGLPIHGHQGSRPSIHVKNLHTTALNRRGEPRASGYLLLTTRDITEAAA